MFALKYKAYIKQQQETEKQNPTLTMIFTMNDSKQIFFNDITFSPS